MRAGVIGLKVCVRLQFVRFLTALFHRLCVVCCFGRWRQKWLPHLVSRLDDFPLDLAGIRDATRVSGINKVGLRRSGFSREVISKLDAVFRIIYRSPNLLLKDSLELARKEFGDCGEVQHMIEFFETSKRGVIRRTEV